MSQKQRNRLPLAEAAAATLSDARHHAAGLSGQKTSLPSVCLTENASGSLGIL